MSRSIDRHRMHRDGEYLDQISAEVAEEVLGDGFDYSSLLATTSDMAATLAADQQRRQEQQQQVPSGSPLLSPLFGALRPESRLDAVKLAAGKLTPQQAREQLLPSIARAQACVDALVKNLQESHQISQVLGELTPPSEWDLSCFACWDALQWSWYTTNQAGAASALRNYYVDAFAAIAHFSFKETVASGQAASQSLSTLAAAAQQYLRTSAPASKKRGWLGRLFG